MTRRARRKRERWWGKNVPFKYRPRRRASKIQPSFYDRQAGLLDRIALHAPVEIEPQKRTPIGKRRDRRRPGKP